MEFEFVTKKRTASNRDRIYYSCSKDKKSHTFTVSLTDQTMARLGATEDNRLAIGYNDRHPTMACITVEDEDGYKCALNGRSTIFKYNKSPSAFTKLETQVALKSRCLLSLTEQTKDRLIFTAE